MNKKHQLLNELGITPVWVLRKAAEDSVVGGNMDASYIGVDGGHEDFKDDGPIHGKSVCVACDQRSQNITVQGHPFAGWFFIEDVSSHTENQTFKKQVKELFNAMVESISLEKNRDFCMIGVDVGCQKCLSELGRQVELISPKIILVFGESAGRKIIGKEASYEKTRGTLYSFKGIPLVVTYHPAFLLKNFSCKRDAWIDLCLAMEVAGDESDVSKRNYEKI